MQLAIQSGVAAAALQMFVFPRLLTVGGGAPARELLKGLLVVSGDLPNVASRVFDHTAAIAIGHVLWLFERLGACRQRPLVGRVDIIDIEVQKCRHRVARANAAYHNERVANSDLARYVAVNVSCRTERLLEELNQPGDVVSHEPRGHAMPTHGGRFSHRCLLLCIFAMSNRLGALDVRWSLCVVFKATVLDRGGVVLRAELYSPGGLFAGNACDKREHEIGAGRDPG